MNWGKSLTLVIIAFMTFILVLVFSFMSKTVDLEYEDYYIREISYQDKIEAESNGLPFKQLIQLKTDEEAVYLILPSNFPKSTKGEIHFYRPDNAKSDIRFELTSDLSQAFPLSLFHSGRYEIRLDWENESKKYFVNKTLFIP